MLSDLGLFDGVKDKKIMLNHTQSTNFRGTLADIKVKK